MNIIKSIVVTFTLFLLACTPASDSSKAFQAAKESRFFRMNINRDPITLDPRKGYDLVSATLHFILYEGLMRLNPDGSLTPAQAKEVRLSEDQMTYTFYLREAKWSNGVTVTAADFEYAWKKILSPDFLAPSANLLYCIENAEAAKRGLISLDLVGIKAVDDQTLVVKLSHPTPYFLNLISFSVFFPTPQKVILQEDHDQPSLVSNGPFKLLYWKHHDKIVCEKNRYYWEADRVNLEKIQINMIVDENTAMHMYENNELDMIGFGYSPLPSSKRRDRAFSTLPCAGSSILCFNVHQFPFHNKNIRLAFSYAINRKEIVENITELGEEVATNAIPPALSDATFSYFQDHDVTKAQTFFNKGLKELGITFDQFPSILYCYSYNEINHQLAQVLQRQLKEALGIDLYLKSCGYGGLLNHLIGRSFTLAQTYWIAQYSDPMSILERFKLRDNAKNYPGWENPDYIDLLERSSVSKNCEERGTLLHLAETLLMKEMPVAPLYHWKTSFMLKDHLAHPPVAPRGVFDISRIYFIPK